MSLASLLLLLSPLFLLTLTLSLVMIVAIRRARPEDVPTVIAAFSHLVDRLSRRRQIGAWSHQVSGSTQTMGSAGSVEEGAQ